MTIQNTIDAIFDKKNKKRNRKGKRRREYGVEKRHANIKGNNY